MLKESKLNSIVKILGEEMISVLDSSQEDEIKTTIALASGVIKETQDSLDSNPKYSETKDNLKALSAGLREVKKFQNAKILYCLSLLEDRKGVTSND